MLSTLYSQPLAQFLSVVSRGSRAERTALSVLAPKEQTLFAVSLEATAKAAYGDAEALKASAALSSIVRLVWNLAPQELFTQPSPNFRGLAARSVAARFEPSATTEQLVADLVVVFKRLRAFYRDGRQVTSFRPGHSDHLGLLRAQGWRCALCLYHFAEDLDRYAAEEEDVCVDSRPLALGEVRMPTTYRRPELDHIVPHLLGGDEPSNWQILCRSCNGGKSDSITSLSKHFNLPSLRAGDFHDLTASKRFAVIAVARRNVADLPSKVDEHLRVFRRQTTGMLNIENLFAELA